jgi:hypothetical protein
MKTLIKITALAALMTFAVISCTPEAELSSVDWKAINSKSDATKNTSPWPRPTSYDFTFSGSLSTSTTATNEVTFTLPASSDFLTGNSGKVESELRKILSFSHFTRPTTTDGKADELATSISYIFIKHESNTITLRLDKRFETGNSSVIAKIDGTMYTFAGGNKLDLAQRGKPGEAVYNDVYKEIYVSGATGPTGFVQPGNKGWTLTLSSIGGGSSNQSEWTPTAPQEVASLSLGGSRITNDIYNTVANQLVSGLKVQKYENGSWNNTGNVTYTSLNGFTVSGITFNDLVPYRVMWEGNAPLLSSGDYFGVKQWIRVVGSRNTEWNSQDYQMKKVYGNASVWYNNYGGQRYNAPVPSASVYSYDKGKNNSVQNIVLELRFDRITYGGNNYTLKNYSQDDTLKKVFKDNFKIAYYSNLNEPKKSGNPNPSAYDFIWRDDVVYLPIKDLEYATVEGYTGTVIRITLDPSFKSYERDYYYYISPEICYTDNRTTFGSAYNWQYNYFRAYDADIGGGGGGGGDDPSTDTLTANVWVQGYIDSDEGDFYWFTANYGQTYYFWWNDADNSDGYYADVRVAAYDSNWDQIFDVDNYSTNSCSFTASSTGIVYVIVYPQSNGNTGYYDIVYNTTGSRPY